MKKIIVRFLMPFVLLATPIQSRTKHKQKKCVELCNLAVGQNLIVNKQLTVCGTINVSSSTDPVSTTGFTGFTGPQGLLGSTGLTGATGATGFTGTTGATGAQGNPGATGGIGNQGARGPVGPSTVSLLKSYIFAAAFTNAESVQFDFVNLYGLNEILITRQLNVGIYTAIPIMVPPDIDAAVTPVVDVHLLINTGTPADAGFVNLSLNVVTLAPGVNLPYQIFSSTIPDFLVTPTSQVQHLVISINFPAGAPLTPDNFMVLSVQRNAATTDEFAFPVYVAATEFRYSTL